MSELKLIGRLTKDRYLHNSELVEKTKFKLLKRMSVGTLSDMIQDAEFDIMDIDFSKFDSGIYELKIINASRDIESGVIDDWNVTLSPVSEEPEDKS